jgi:acyl-CoA thioesterase-2
VHSLHAYFIRPAHPARDVVYRVRRVRDGRSFSIRSVEGWQDDALAFVLDASFQRPERGFVHDAPAPDVPPPEALPGEQSRYEAARRADPARFAAWPAGWHAERGPFEMRTVEDLWGAGVQPPRMHTWVRLRSAVGDPGLQPAIAAYFSDDPVMDNALLPHVGRFHDGRLATASLDHAMWFHEPVDLHEWHLFAQDSPVASGARGLTRGLLFDRSGRLVASVAQEILMRVRT